MTRIAPASVALAASLAVLALSLAGCDKLPDRPDEAKFRAMNDHEKCRTTASRAIMCTDELMVAQVRTLLIDGAGDMADAVERDMTKDKPLLPKAERKQNIDVHRATCAAEIGYAEGVFACWAIEDCKKFATCVVEKSARPSSPPATQ